MFWFVAGDKEGDNDSYKGNRVHNGRGPEIEQDLHAEDEDEGRDIGQEAEGADEIPADEGDARVDLPICGDAK